MPKGYIVASVEVVDPAIYAVYTQKLMELLRSAGVRPLVVGGRGKLFSIAKGERDGRPS